LAPCAPGGGGCQRFAEPVLSPLLYNSNLLVFKKGIFEAAKIYEFFDMNASNLLNITGKNPTFMDFTKFVNVNPNVGLYPGAYAGNRCDQ
jgi:hypothetical protein